jgi:superfamily II DNA/RNA helicase
MNYTGEPLMKPEIHSKELLSITQAKAKMLEYAIQEEDQELKIETNPQKLFSLTIGLLGDYSHKLNQVNVSQEELIESKRDLRFSSRFFDAYVQSELDHTLDDYLILIGSATYYLCDLPGNSFVMIKKLNAKPPDIYAEELDKLLFWLLQSDVAVNFNGIYREYLQAIVNCYYQFANKGINERRIITILDDFRRMIYNNGSDRCLLFVDIIAAVTKRKIENSCWKALPYYSDLSIDVWKSTLQKPNFMKEFWPAQHLIGEKDILKGKSAVIQMPTSAGKTKTSELIIRSAFLNNRTSMAVIIAPFRALCHEINNDLSRAFRNEKDVKIVELSDSLQMDVVADQLQGNKQIWIVTPEKYFYVISHNKDIALLSNLYIFDEGHQFDNGDRGITYELLLTTLLLLIPKDTQKILISAVINNSEQISKWLNNEINVVSGEYLMPTFKTIGFVSWENNYGQIHYVKEDNNEEEDFCIPKVIEEKQLKRIGKERTVKLFPTKTDGRSISLFLGLKLVKNGSVAIFCGKKDSITKICRIMIDISQRNFPINIKELFLDEQEVKRLSKLYAANLGEDSISTMSAKLGVFSHHSNIPHGIRIAVEYAMHENLIKFIICTSTLAQGVNLPIRYLIISSFNQNREYIKARDFNNLIGRAGRSGIHTEGSILFADPRIFDGKNLFKNNWLWNKAQELLVVGRNEPCISELVTIFDPLFSTDKEKKVEFKANLFVKNYLDSSDIISKLIDEILENNHYEDFTKENLEQQFSLKINLISAIENFLLSNWDEIELLKGENDYSDIVTKTFGYSLSDDEKRSQLSDLFNIIENYIRIKITDPDKRRVYGRTFYGIKDAMTIEEWYENNLGSLLLANNEESLLDIIWNIMEYLFVNRLNLRLTNIDKIKLVMMSWISGISYNKLVDIFHKNEIKTKWGKTTREINIDKVVDICDKYFSYNACLVLNALYEFTIQNQDNDVNKNLSFLLQKLQKQLKFGLPDETSSIIYEIGFCDRMIAQDIKNSLNISNTDRLGIIHEIKSNGHLAIEIISKYPIYYQTKMKNLIN